MDRPAIRVVPGGQTGGPAASLGLGGLTSSELESRSQAHPSCAGLPHLLHPEGSSIFVSLVTEVIDREVSLPDLLTELTTTQVPFTPRQYQQSRSRDVSVA